MDDKALGKPMTSDEADRIVAVFKAAPTDADADQYLSKVAAERYLTVQELGWMTKALGYNLVRQTDRERLNPGYIDSRRLCSPRAIARADYAFEHPKASWDEVCAVVSAMRGTTPEEDAAEDAREAEAEAAEAVAVAELAAAMVALGLVKDA